MLKSNVILNIDEKIENADWPKRTDDHMPLMLMTNKQKTINMLLELVNYDPLQKCDRYSKWNGCS